MLYYLSLGSNLGDREQQLNVAIEQMEVRIGHIVARSSFFYSEPWGFKSEHAFCNICVALWSPLPPIDILTITQDIERHLGRTQKTSAPGQYADRLIDIDLLQAFLPNGQEITLTSPRLTLPHPLMQQRDFVMIPLSEIR